MISNKYRRNIAILSLFHQVPAQPSSNQPPERFRGVDERYTLSFEEERKLSHTIAFISSFEESSNNVLAVCVKENYPKLDVLVAVNQEMFQDGKKARDLIGKNLCQIFELLSRYFEDSDMEIKVFQAIATMCQQKILQRLGLRGKSVGNRHRQSIQQGLELMVAGLRLRLNRNHNLMVLSKDVIQKVKQWRDHQTTQEIIEIVGAIFKISRVPDLSQLINRLSNQTMDPSNRTGLLNAIHKTARYREAARYLCHMARKCLVARNMHYIPVSLPQNAFLEPSKREPEPTLPTVLRNLPLQFPQKNRLNELYPMLKKSHIRAQQEYSQMVASKKTKIHAEVQLIYHIDANSTGLMPRVIASNKDACFLCNAVIQAHGKFHMSRSHGRLYEKWRLPNSPVSSNIEKALNRILENQIIQTITFMLDRRQGLLLKYPLESTISTWASMESIFVQSKDQESEALLAKDDKYEEKEPRIATQAGVIEVEETTFELKPAELEEQKDAEEESTELKEVDSEKELTGLDPFSCSKSNVYQKVPSGMAASAKDSDQLVAPANTLPSLIPLSKGETRVIRLKANTCTGFYEAPPIRLQLEYEAKPKSDKEREMCLTSNSGITTTQDGSTASLVWLDACEVSKLNEGENFKLVNLDSMEECVEMSREDLSHVCLYARGSFLRIKLD